MRSVLVSLLGKLLVLVWIPVLVGCGQRQLTPFEQAQELFYQKSYDAAIAQCDRALAADAKNIDWWILRGQIHRQMGDLKAAEADFTTVIDLEPENSEGFHHRAMVRKEAGDEDAGMVDSFKARALDPRYKIAYSTETRTPTVLGEAADADSDTTGTTSDEPRPELPGQAGPAPIGPPVPGPIVTAEPDDDVEHPAGSRVSGPSRPPQRHVKAKPKDSLYQRW